MTAQQYGGEAERGWWDGLRRGLARRCPGCGTTRLFQGYGSVVPRCSACGNDHSLYRADDGPAYLTIFAVGHIVVPLMLFVYHRTDWSNLAHAALWLPLTLALTLALLPVMKGGVIGLQWAFDVKSDERR